MSHNPKAKEEKNGTSRSIYDSGVVSEYDLSHGFSSEIETPLSGHAIYECDPNAPTNSSAKRDNEKSERQLCITDLSISDSGIINDVTSLVLDINLKEDKCKPVPELINSENDLEKIFIRDEDGDTMLHLAVMNRNEDMVKKILSLLPNSNYLNLRNFYQQTCLHLSVLINSPKITRLLLVGGAKTNIEDINGNTAFHLTCSLNNLACLNALLTPVTISEQKNVCLLYEPQYGDVSIYLNEYNYDGLSCLHFAAGHCDRRILMALLRYGADINITELKGGCTVLHKAAINDDETLVSCLLLQQGIDVDKQTYARKTAFQLCSRNLRIRQLLLNKQCDPYESDPSDSESESDNDSISNECYE